MKRRSWRVCDRKAGFSMVELLVTIVIAGIAFAAMVPMFVQASKASASDKARVVALNIAQDRIEKVRRLNFASLIPANLNVDDPDSPFATTQYAKTATGQKPFTVTCEAVDLPVSETDTRVVSKKVTVTVSWSTPSPGGAVSTSTIIYRQYAGPQITDFTVSPYDVDKDWITSSDVALTVTVSPADLASMEPVMVGSRELMGYVLITIAPVDGSAVIPAIRIDYAAVSGSTFTANWIVSSEGAGVGDGYYKFTAVAYTANKSPGNTWSFSKHVESGRPGPVRNLQGSAAGGTASLTWLPSLSADVDHYKVYRTNPDGTTVLVAGDPLTQPKWKETGLTNTGLVDHETYVYTVYVYDQAYVPGQPGHESTPASVSLYVFSASDLDAPLPATNLKGDPSADSASLIWTASASTFVIGYQVFAGGNTTTPVKTVNTPYATVSQAWNTTAYYQVKPYRAPLLLSTSWASIQTGYPVQNVGSPAVQWVRVTTQLQTLYTLTVINDASASNKKANISLYYLGPTGMDLAKLISTKNNCAYGSTTAAKWTGLAYGRYRWSWTTTDNPSRTGQREDSFAVGSGGTVSVTHHCIAVP